MSGSSGADINIYKDNGTLTGNRTVTMDDKTLFFNSTATTGTSHFNVDGSTLNVDAVNNRVGVGTTTPYANMEVKATATTTVPDGIIIPKLTRLELTNKGNTLYGANQKGAMIYITDITGGNTLSQRVNVTSEGFYYFDGAKWIGIQNFSETEFIPKVLLSARKTTTQNLGANQMVRITFPTVLSTDGNYVSSTGVYNVPSGESGIYQVCSMYSVLPNTGSNAFDMQVRFGSSQDVTLSNQNSWQPAWGPYRMGSCVADYVSGPSTIEVYSQTCSGCSSNNYAYTNGIITITKMSAN